MQVVNSGYISPNAADVCGGLDFDSGAISCLRASLNKEYTAAEARVCSSQSFDSGATSCMESCGKPYVGNDDYDNAELSASERLSRIERLAVKVKRQLKNGDIAHAIVNIGLIIELATVDNGY